MPLPSIFNFGDHERDLWVASQARALAPGSRVLDVGAGPCKYRPLFAHCVYKSQDFGAHQASNHGPMPEREWIYGRIDYVSDAASIPVPDASFDAVLCTEVLEHVPEPIRVVGELARVLRPGGKLILTAPLGSGVHQEPDHYYGGYTPFWYQRFLGAAGFREVQVTPNGGFFKHYGQESRRFSALIDPRRVPGAVAPVLAPLWALSLPWFRVIVPLACHALDRIDRHRAFTVGYHVTAIRGPSQSTPV